MTDLDYLQLTLRLAAQGAALVSPNPLVGSVVVKDGEIVGRGYHRYDEVKHAEVWALEEAGPRARDATVYVNLEPCAHQGEGKRTPPCVRALIDARVRRVVASMTDPNPRVDGRGFAMLREAGIEVTVGLLEPEARRLNEKYAKFVTTGRPFVHLKVACSLDGRIATRTGEAKWITGEEARAASQTLRHEYDAIMLGVGTILADDPLLSDRTQQLRRRPLLRAVLDSRLRTPLSSQLVRTARELPLIIFAAERQDAHSHPNELTTRQQGLEAAGAEVVRVKAQGERPDLALVLAELGRRAVTSLIVEGGAEVSAAVIEQRLVDKITFYLAPKIIGGRGAVPAVGGLGCERLGEALELTEVEYVRRGVDWEVTGYPTGVSSFEFKVEAALTELIASNSKLETLNSKPMKAKRSLGQNFLVGARYPQRIVEAVAPRAGETLVEIGPGQGALTDLLVESGAQVVAVELDRELIPHLAARFVGRTNFRLIEGDALAIDFCQAIAPAPSARVVANLPYYVSTPILQHLIAQRRCLGELTLMLQREVVERVTARPGGKEYGYLSVLVQFFCEAERLFDVPPGAFRPAPKVYSSVVRLRVRPQPASPVGDEEFFLQLISVLFAQRRKTILNNLRAARGRLGLPDEEQIRAALAAAGLDPRRRAETLSIPESAQLADQLLSLRWLEPASRPPG